MKYLVFSDLHAHNFSDCSTLVREGVNSRLQDCLDTVSFVRETAMQNQVDAILFGGDLFHVGKKIDTPVFNETHAAIRALSEVAPVHLLVGNHDQVNNRGTIHALQTFSHKEDPHPLYVHTVHCAFTTYALSRDDPQEQQTFYFCPYRRRRADILPGLQACEEYAHQHSGMVALIHQALSGIPVGPGVFPDEEVSMDDLPKSTALNLLGHYHKHLIIDARTMSIGSPLQHHWQDEGVTKYIWLMESGKGPTPIATPAPQFQTFEYSHWDEISQSAVPAVGNAFVRVLVGDLDNIAPETIAQYRESLVDQGARFVKIEPLAAKDDMDPDFSLVSDMHTDHGAAVTEYVHSQDTGALSKHRLVAMGVQALEGIQ